MARTNTSRCARLMENWIMIEYYIMVSLVWPKASLRSSFFLSAMNLQPFVDEEGVEHSLKTHDLVIHFVAFFWKVTTARCNCCNFKELLYNL